MTLAVLGATGRLGQMLQGSWGKEGARWFGRDAQAADLQGVTTLIDMRGIVRGDFALNVEIARKALDLAQAAGIPRVLLPSTAAVYGRMSGPLTEDRAAPDRDYGRAKLEMEAMAADHPQPSCALRICNVAGADAILGGWYDGFELQKLPDGRSPSRSYLGPETLAQVIRQLADTPDLPRVLNVAPPDVVEMGALLDEAALAWVPKPADGETIACVHLDSTRLARHLRIEPARGRASVIVAEWRRHSGWTG